MFTGPIFTADGLLHQNEEDEAPIRIPAGFWKVLVISYELRLKAAAFLVWQVDYDKERPVSFDPHLEQVRITTLEHIVGLAFGPLRDVDPLKFVSRGEGYGRMAPAVMGLWWKRGILCCEGEYGHLVTK